MTLRSRQLAAAVEGRLVELAAEQCSSELIEMAQEQVDIVRRQLAEVQRQQAHGGRDSFGPIISWICVPTWAF
jgi:hypothetical protein